MNKQIGDGTVAATADLIRQFFLQDAISHDLAKKVLDHILISVGQEYGYEGRQKVESYFFAQSARAWEALSRPEHAGLNCPHCGKGFENSAGIATDEKPERSEEEE